jgi:hypothetical protein
VFAAVNICCQPPTAEKNGPEPEYEMSKIQHKIWQVVLRPYATGDESAVCIASADADYYRKAQIGQHASSPDFLPDSLHDLSRHRWDQVAAIWKQLGGAEVVLCRYDELSRDHSGGFKRRSTGDSAVILWVGRIREIAPGRAVVTYGRYRHWMAASTDVVQFTRWADEWLLSKALIGWMT